jgi:hypothetical protein
MHTACIDALQVFPSTQTIPLWSWEDRKAFFGKGVSELMVVVYVPMGVDAVSIDGRSVRYWYAPVKSSNCSVKS